MIHRETDRSDNNAVPSLVKKTVTFGLPLISSRVAKNWPMIQRLLANTLHSVFNQNTDAIHVIIACHEAPDIPEAQDPRVSIVRVPFDIPRFQWEQEVDRMRKLEMIGVHHRSRGGGWLFILDSDDFVAEDLASRILASTADKALVVATGYKLDASRMEVQKMRRFWRKCGSSCAINWEVDELPESFPQDEPPVYHRFAETRHIVQPELFTLLKWRFSFLEAPAITYLVNHGQNQSDIISALSLKWRLYFMLARRERWGGTVAARFGVPAEAVTSAIYRGDALFATQRIGAAGD
jgi:hypothetical protein